MDIRTESLKKHHEWHGKIEVVSRVKIKSAADLSLAYTPGVAEPCIAIRDDYSKSWELTRRSNLVAVITDGSAVLGLGNIGPEAGMPVMEGKCCLFKEFAGIDAIPICVRSQNVEELVRSIYLISGSFGGINLEDIAAPRCFEVERRLKEICDIPVFHDDQHGTAIVVGAAVINALKVVNKEIDKVRIVINGAGAAGTAIARHLLALGANDIIMTDKCGILYDGLSGLSSEQKELCKLTNLKQIVGTLADAIYNADIFIGVSAPGIVTKKMVSSMAPNACVFPLANPVPEISPEDAFSAGAAVVGTGRSDYPNQINNVLAFPGVFRGALDVRAKEINESMKVAATFAIASLVKDDLCASCILPKPFDSQVVPLVARAVAEAALKTGAANL